MKKLSIIAIMLVVMVVFGIQKIEAKTLDQIKVEASSLLKQIEALSQQAQALTSIFNIYPTMTTSTVTTPSGIVSSPYAVSTNSMQVSTNPIMLPTTSTLKLGDAGQEVKSLQELLAQKGYLQSVPDGKFGTATQNAVKAFQTEQNLKVDGIAGAQVKSIVNNMPMKEATDLSPASLYNTKTISTERCLPTTKPWIKLLSPNGGETYSASQPYKVTWDSCNIRGNIAIGLEFPSSFNLNFSTTNAVVSNSGIYNSSAPESKSFYTPNGFQYGNYYKIKVYDENTGTIVDSSDREFKIIDGTSTTTPTSSINNNKICDAELLYPYNGQVFYKSPNTVLDIPIILKVKKSKTSPCVWKTTGDNIPAYDGGNIFDNNGGNFEARSAGRLGQGSLALIRNLNTFGFISTNKPDELIYYGIYSNDDVPKNEKVDITITDSGKNSMKIGILVKDSTVATTIKDVKKSQ